MNFLQRFVTVKQDGINVMFITINQFTFINFYLMLNNKFKRKKKKKEEKKFQKIVKGENIITSQKKKLKKSRKTDVYFGLAMI